MFVRYRVGKFFAVLAAAFAVMCLSSVPRARAQAEPAPLRFKRGADEMIALADAVQRKLSYVPNQVVIRFKDGVSAAGQQRALSSVRSRPVASSLQWRGPVAVLVDPTQSDATILAAQLREQPEVAYAEPNYLRHVTSAPNDPSFSSRQWNLQTLDMPRAWDISPGAKDTITVAVLDTGVTTTMSSFSARTWNGTSIVTITVPFDVNPDLAGSRLVAAQDFWGDSETTVVDTSGHGTHVSSTIGEDTNNDLALAGIAYKVKIMPVKVCGSYWDLQFEYSASGLPGFFPSDITSLCDSVSVSSGIRYAADNGAKVINLSLGGTEPSLSEEEAIKYAVSKGVFVAIAAGNEFEEGNPTTYPARLAQDIDGAMAVGAVSRSLKHAAYSSAGSYVEIAAPGGDFGDGGLNGLIWQSSIYGPDSDPEEVLFPRFDRYAETPEEGTSMAAPHVAGIAALIMSRGVTKPAAVEALIKATARDLGASGRDDLFGFGLIQPRPALLGFGFKK